MIGSFDRCVDLPAQTSLRHPQVIGDSEVGDPARQNSTPAVLYAWVEEEVGHLGSFG